MIYILIGPPGSGKSTQSQKIADQPGWDRLVASAILRANADAEKQAQLDAGQMMPDEYTIGLVLKTIATKLTSDPDQKLILDGYPRSVEQIKALSEAQPENLGLLFWLDFATVEAVIDRLQKRGRADDHIAGIKKRLQIYKTNIGPIIETTLQAGIPVVRLCASQTKDQVADQIDCFIKASLKRRGRSV